jgi:hypothetical protein
MNSYGKATTRWVLILTGIGSLMAAPSTDATGLDLAPARA